MQKLINQKNKFLEKLKLEPVKPLVSISSTSERKTERPVVSRTRWTCHNKQERKKNGGGGGISYYIEANIPEKNFWVSDKKQIQVSCGGEE